MSRAGGDPAVRADRAPEVADAMDCIDDGHSNDEDGSGAPLDLALVVTAPSNDHDHELDGASRDSFPAGEFEDEFVPKIVHVKTESHPEDGGVKRRKRISLETKLEIIRRLENNEKVCDICRDFGLASSTVCTINGQAQRIKAKAVSIAPKRTGTIKQLPRKRSSIMEEMEKSVCSWIQDQNRISVSPSRSAIKMKAKATYEELRTKTGRDHDADTFNASTGWYTRFKNRFDIGPKDDDTMVCDCVHLQQVIDDGEYSSRQVFTVGETRLFWKLLPDKMRPFVGDKTAASSSDFLSLALGCNAAGDMKLKPLMVYHTESPTPLKGYAKTRLPVIWRSNRKALVNKTLFEEWFTLYFCPAIEHYCSRLNIAHKALLVIGDDLCHPDRLNELSEHVRVEFLPGDTAMFQPMKQGILTEFKLRYLQKTILNLAPKEDDPNYSRQYWQKFNILNAIDNIAESWEEISHCTINTAWRTIWPDCVHFYEESRDTIADMLSSIVFIVYEMGFPEFNRKDVTEWLELHNQQITSDELWHFEKLAKAENNEDEETQPLRELSISCLAEARKYIEKGLEIYSQQDPHRERSAKVIRLVHQAIQCYNDAYKEKQKRTTQNLLTQHFCATHPPGSSQKISIPIPIVTKKKTLPLVEYCDVKTEDSNSITYTITY